MNNLHFYSTQQQKNVVEKNNYFPSHFIGLLKFIQIHSCFEGPPSKMFDYGWFRKWTGRI